MEVTDYMLQKWTKAGFELIIAVLLLIYLDRLILELQTNFEEMASSSADTLFVVLEAILYIITFWLIVAAALNILSGFRQPKTSLDQMHKKLDNIEKKLFPVQEPEVAATQSNVVEQAPKISKAKEEELPPPPPEPSEKL